MITQPHLSAGGRSWHWLCRWEAVPCALAERGSLEVIVLLSGWCCVRAQAASSCCEGRLGTTAMARAGGGPRGQQQDTQCSRVLLISVLYSHSPHFPCHDGSRATPALAPGVVMKQNSESLKLALGRLQRAQR